MHVTPEIIDQILTLRTSGLSMQKIATKIGASETTVFRCLHARPSPEPKVESKSPPKLLLPKSQAPSSVPMRRRIDHAARKRCLAAPPTKSELYAELALAWRNTDARS
jgi:hypothetical protein